MSSAHQHQKPRISRLYDWQDLTKRELATTLAGCFLAIITIALAVEFSLTRAAFFMVSGLTVLSGVGFYYISFLCPRCRQHFFQLMHPNNGKCCVHCHLTKWSPYDTFRSAP